MPATEDQKRQRDGTAARRTMAQEHDREARQARLRLSRKLARFAGARAWESAFNRNLATNARRAA